MVASEHWKPRPYMVRAVKKMIGEPAFGLFLQPGLGKTSISLAAFEVLRQRGFVKKLLVLGPLRPLQLTWPREVEKWHEFSHLRVVLVHGPKKEKALREDADVYLLNYEGLQWFSSQPKALWPDMLVCDESTRLKHPRTQRFKTLKAMLPSFKRRYILTGTPAPNGLIDLFGQLYVLDQGDALGRYVTHYRREYFFQAGFKWVPVPGADELIQKRIASKVLHLEAKDHISLPPVVKTDVIVPFPGEMRMLYKKMKNDLALALSSGKVTAKNAGVLTTKLRQLTGGAVYLDEDVDPGNELRGPRRVQVVHDAKIEALAELVDELSGQPLLVAYEYQHEVERLAKRFPSAVVFGGPRKIVEQQEAAWNAREIELMFVHPQRGALGLNLQSGGSALAWFSLSWNLELYDQMIDRLWRSGQKQTVYVYHFMIEETVDRTVRRALESKARTQEELLAMLKEDIRK